MDVIRIVISISFLFCDSSTHLSKGTLIQVVKRLKKYRLTTW